MKKVKVLVAIPTSRYFETITWFNLSETKDTSSNVIDFYYRVGDGLISRARNDIGRYCLNHQVKYDYLMFIDDDLTWDPKQKPIDKLISQKKDIICGIYPIRDNTLRPAVRTKEMQKLLIAKKYQGQKVKIPKDKVFEIEFANGGFLLIKRECLEAVYKFSSHPFTCNVDKYGEYLSEDYAFCYRAARLGYKIWADSSIKLGHIGQSVFYLDGIKPLIIK
jgi:GT2 family glycosyltransferase